MTNRFIRILLIEDDIIDQMSFKRLINEKGLPYKCTMAGSVKKAQEILSDIAFDVVIIDYNLGDGTAFDIFDYIVDTPFIFTTGGGDEQIAVEAMKAGAFYYHIKDPDRNYLELLPVSIDKALKNRQMIIDQKKAEEALRESEEKFRTISSAANDAIVMQDYNGNVVFWNKAAEKIFGYNKDEIIGQELHKFIIPQQSNDHFLKGLKFHWQQGLEAAIGKRVEIKAKTKNSKIVDIGLSLSAVKLGDELNTVAIMRDITQRKKAQSALIESEERYRTLQSNLPVGIYRSNRKGTFISSNPAMVKILGYNSIEEVLQLKATDLYPDLKIRDIFVKKIEQEGAVSSYEMQLLNKSGNTFWAAVTAKAFVNYSNDKIYYDGVVEDITIQKEAKEQLRQSKERLDIILHDIGNGVLVIGQSDEIILMNQTAKDLLGVESSDSKDIIFRDLLDNCYDKGESILEALKGDSFSNLQLKIEYPVQRTLYTTATPFTDIDGKSAGKIIILADVTKEKDIEQMKTDFVSSVSHELRTPLTSIMGFSKTILMKSDLDEKTRKEFTEIIYKESKRLSNLIEDVLSISRIESGRTNYILYETDLKPIVNEVYKIYRIQAENKDVKISCKIEKDLPAIMADRNAIHQVAVNLVGNSIKFTPIGGEISISLTTNNSDLILSVKDNGLGIPKKDQDKIFDKFYRVYRPGKEIQGTGLGLPIVKKIIDAHEGIIELISEEGKGTEFLLKFPLIKDNINICEGENR